MKDLNLTISKWFKARGTQVSREAGQYHNLPGLLPGWCLCFHTMKALAFISWLELVLHCWLVRKVGLTALRVVGTHYLRGKGLGSGQWGFGEWNTACPKLSLASKICLVHLPRELLGEVDLVLCWWIPDPQGTVDWGTG